VGGGGEGRRAHSDREYPGADGRGPEPRWISCYYYLTSPSRVAEAQISRDAVGVGPRSDGSGGAATSHSVPSRPALPLEAAALAVPRQRNNNSAPWKNKRQVEWMSCRAKEGYAPRRDDICGSAEARGDKCAAVRQCQVEGPRIPVCLVSLSPE
jgi:hypothetical protein